MARVLVELRTISLQEDPSNDHVNITTESHHMIHHMSNRLCQVYRQLYSSTTFTYLLFYFRFLYMAGLIQFIILDKLFTPHLSSSWKTWLKQFLGFVIDFLIDASFSSGRDLCLTSSNALTREIWIGSLTPPLKKIPVIFMHYMLN